MESGLEKKTKKNTRLHVQETICSTDYIRVHILSPCICPYIHIHLHKSIPILYIDSSNMHSEMYFLQWNSLFSSSKPCILGIYRNQWLCVLEQQIPGSHTWSTDLVVLRNDPQMTVLRHTGYSDENRIDKYVAGLPGFKQSPS